MNRLLVTFQKELFSYCISPVSWIIAVVFYLWRGFEVYGTVLGFHAYRADQDLLPTATYGLTSTFWMVVLVPGILTMLAFVGLLVWRANVEAAAAPPAQRSERTTRMAATLGQ